MLTADQASVFTMPLCLSIFALYLSLWLIAMLPVWGVIVAVPAAAMVVEFGVKPLVSEPDPACECSSPVPR